MLGPIGMQELIIIFVIALIVFGPRKLPQLGKSLGKSIAEFKRASNELRSTLEEEIRVEETRREIMEPIERRTRPWPSPSRLRPSPNRPPRPRRKSRLPPRSVRMADTQALPPREE